MIINYDFRMLTLLAFPNNLVRHLVTADKRPILKINDSNIHKIN